MRDYSINLAVIPKWGNGRGLQYLNSHHTHHSTIRHFTSNQQQTYTQRHLILISH
jgi:hypothetical protein